MLSAVALIRETASNMPDSRQSSRFPSDQNSSFRFHVCSDCGRLPFGTEPSPSRSSVPPLSFHPLKSDGLASVKGSSPRRLGMLLVPNLKPSLPFVVFTSHEMGADAGFWLPPPQGWPSPPSSPFLLPIREETPSGVGGGCSGKGDGDQLGGAPCRHGRGHEAPSQDPHPKPHS